MREILKIVLIGLILLMGCIDKQVDLLENKIIQKNRYNDILNAIEIKHLVNPIKYEKLYSITVDLKQKCDLIIDNLLSPDNYTNNDIIKIIEEINKLEIEYLGDEDFNSNIILKNSDKLNNILKKKDKRIELVNYLYSDIHFFLNEMIKVSLGSDISFNHFIPVIKEKSNKVTLGQLYESEIYISAIDTTYNPMIFIGEFDTIKNDYGLTYHFHGDYDSLFVKNGIGIYKSISNKIGEKDYSGIIQLRHESGGYINIPFKENYFVTK